MVTSWFQSGQSSKVVKNTGIQGSISEVCSAQEVYCTEYMISVYTLIPPCLPHCCPSARTAHFYYTVTPHITPPHFFLWGGLCKCLRVKLVSLKTLRGHFEILKGYFYWLLLTIFQEERGLFCTVTIFLQFWSLRGKTAIAPMIFVSWYPLQLPKSASSLSQLKHNFLVGVPLRYVINLLVY